MEGNLRDIRLNKLTERAKELRCIYEVIEILKDENAGLGTIFNSILEAIPPGYQYTTVCEACIIFEGNRYPSPDFVETHWKQKAEIVIDNHVAGEIQVCYVQDVFGQGIIFLPDEQKLLNTIADNLSRYIFYKRLKKTMQLSLLAEPLAERNDDSSLLAFESDEHWKWRLNISEKIAGLLDMERLGVQAIYIIGSTKTGTAGPGSDIDLLIHIRASESQENELKAWLDGWGLGLAEMNYLKTGYITKGSLIDYHIITDEDISKKNSFAAMIGSTENSARLLRKRNV